jgi:serine/threonine protein kinase
MKIKLVVCEGPARGAEHELVPGKKITVGRSAAATLSVEDPAVSRVHCEIVPDGDFWVLRDLDSRNHVFVGKRPTQEHVLADGDVFRLGKNTAILFRVHDTTREVETVEQPRPPELEQTMQDVKNLAALAGPSLVGQSLGEFRVAQKLGASGAAVCYRALQPSLNRNVLLQVYPAKLGRDPAFRERLLAEVRSISPLLHPHILQLFDLEEEAGRLFLVMEYFKGDTLAEHLERKNFLPIRPAIDLTIQICDALGYAAGQQVTVTEVDPADVLIDDKFRGKLRLFRDPGAGATPPSHLSILAPELLSPKRAGDLRSAVYSLGALLFRCVGGMPPFQGDDPDTLKAKILMEAPRDLKKLNIRASDGLCEIVRKALEKLPQNRHQDPTELARDLKKLVGPTR